MLKKLKEFAVRYELFFIAIPWIVGGIGYRMQGESLLDAFYGSFCLYFANPISDEYNILIELARWTGPIAMVAGISNIIYTHLKNQGSKIWFFLLRGNNVIYSNYVKAEDLDPKMGKASIVIEDGAKNWKKKRHIILFDNDFESFSFYRKYEKVLAGKEVYMCLQSMDPALLKANHEVRFFQINDAIARMFWKGTGTENGDGDLCGFVAEKAKEAKGCRIAIFGFGDLGKHMLERALQMHLYSKDQQITYYVIGEFEKYKASHSTLDLMNKDQIVYLREEQLKDWSALREMDMIILTGKPDMEQIQMVLGNSECKIYYYSPDGGEIGRLADTERLAAYGQNEKLLTEKNIIWHDLYGHAMAHNTDYNKTKSGTEQLILQWDELPGFLRESNLSSEDYGETIRKLYYGKSYDREELAKLEHIRWCRFHFLHYWRRTPGEKDGKDPKRRLHPYLRPYRDLDEQVKGYDRSSIDRWLGENYEEDVEQKNTTEKE